MSSIKLNIAFYIALFIFFYQVYILYTKWIDDLNLDSEVFVTVFYLFITLLVARIDQLFNEKIDKFDGLFKNAVAQANLTERVSCIGPSSKALEYIMRDAAKASTVFNANLAIRDPSSTSKDIVEIYNSFFHNKDAHVWNDLVGLPDLFGHRYSALKIPKGKILKINVLRHSAPIINFIQLQINGKMRTYYGWVGFNTTESNIFMTDDKKLNQLFRDQYNRVFEAYRWTGDDSEIQIKSGKPSSYIKKYTQLVDKVGYWLTIEWQKKDNKIVPHTYGLIKIDFKDNQLEITPEIYDEKFALKKNTKHVSSVKNYENRLYFDFKYTNENYNEVSGMCSYEFKSENGKSKPVLNGQLHRYSDWTLNKITGVEIGKTRFNRIKFSPNLLLEAKNNVPRLKE